MASKIERDCISPPRTADQSRYLFNMLTWQLGRQGTIAYEGHFKDARPIPESTLRDFAKVRERELRNGAFAGLSALRQSLYFTFHKVRFRAAEPEIIHIPTNDLWRLVRPGDWVLLSDGYRHHVTFVFHVDHEADLIFFLDMWPDHFILLEGQNNLGVKARKIPYEEFQLFNKDGRIMGGTSHPWPDRLDAAQLFKYRDAFRVGGEKQLVSITRNEFKRTIQGLVTIDTPALYETYRDCNEQVACRADVRHAFARTFLDWPSLRFRLDELEWREEPFIEAAIDLSEQALASAQSDGGDEAVFTATYLNRVAALIQGYASIEKSGRTDEKADVDRVNELRELLMRDDREPGLNAIDAYRLGVAAKRATRLEDARIFLTHAVDLKENYVDARLSLASVSEDLQDYAGAIAAATDALELAEARENAARQRRAERHQRDDWGRELDEHDEKVAIWHRAQALGVRAGAFAVTGRYSEGLEDALEMTRIRPDLSKGYGLEALIERALAATALSKGASEEAVEHLKQVNRYYGDFESREQDPHVRVQLREAIQQQAAGLVEATGQGSAFFDEYRKAMVDHDWSRTEALVNSSPLTARLVAEGSLSRGEELAKQFNSEGALAFYGVALNILEQIGDELNVGLASNDLAVIHFLRRELHAALAAAQRAYIIFQRHQSAAGLKTAGDTLNRIYAGFGNRHELEAFLREHLKYTQEYGFAKEREYTLEDLKRLGSG